jgi:outer membrane protein TolC
MAALFLGMVTSGAAAQASGGSAASAASSSDAQGLFFGGVPHGEKSAGVLRLSLANAIQKGLRYNLGVLVGDQSVTAVRGARLAALSRLLPQVSASAGIMHARIDMDDLGLGDAIPGSATALNAGAAVKQSILDFSSLRHYRAAEESLKAAEFSNENARDTAAYVVTGLYLQAASNQSRIEAAEAQVTTAQSLYDLAVDQKAAGVVSGIETLRAQVELQAEQQRLIVAEDQFAKDKLTLARAVGLPLGQKFDLVDAMSFTPIPAPSLEESVARAMRERPDYQSAEAGVRAAELERGSAAAGNLPSLGASADYRLISPLPLDGHGSLATVGASLNIPIFTGGAVKSRVMEAEAALNRRKAELEDMKAQIHYDIQKAFLDLDASANRVRVAESAIQLAREQVEQSQDRFRAGVTNNVEVVQAQDALATASENRIASIQAHNMAKLALARALGVSGDEYESFLKGK